MLQIVVPMAGDGSRFQERGYVLPKPLIEVAGRSMIGRVVDNLRLQCPHKFIFLCRSEHLDQFPLADLLTVVAPGSAIVPVRNKTEGAACTVLLATDEIRVDQEILIANCDQLVDLSIDLFVNNARERDLDGSILTFKDNESKWSFAKINDKGFVTEVAEKKVISPYATVGVYYFKKAGIFLDAACSMIEKDIRVNGEYYVCPVYNEVLEVTKKIGIYNIEKELMHGIGTPQDLEKYLLLQQSVEEMRAV